MKKLRLKGYTFEAGESRKQPVVVVDNEVKLKLNDVQKLRDWLNAWIDAAMS